MSDQPEYTIRTPVEVAPGLWVNLDLEPESALRHAIRRLRKAEAGKPRLRIRVEVPVDA